MANVFKVGDIITGIPDSGFGVTSDKSLCEVTDQNVIDGEQLLTVKLIEHKESKYKKEIGSEFIDIPSEFFEFATEEVQASFKATSATAKKMKPDTKHNYRAGLKIEEYPDGTIKSSFNKDREMVIETANDRKEALKKFIQEADNDKNFVKNLVGLSDKKGFEVFRDLFDNKELLKNINGFVNFFKEFQFEPNFRFMNTLSLKLSQDLADGQNYIKNYFKLINSPYQTAVEDKCKSQEMKQLLYSISIFNPKEVINKRFKVYYGSQGTGKTTKAMEETEGRCIVCNNSMLPQDLLEDFTFDDGKPGFHPSMFCDCLTKGQKITLDEINLLPFETVRFLQGILDGKKQFSWKGNTINIADGFSVIGTMNLMVNGMAYGLPEPLVDRCLDIQESQLKGEDLLSALM